MKELPKKHERAWRKCKKALLEPGDVDMLSPLESETVDVGPKEA